VGFAQQARWTSKEVALDVLWAKEPNVRPMIVQETFPEYLHVLAAALEVLTCQACGKSHFHRPRWRHFVLPHSNFGKFEWVGPPF
jgi:hypothetical protein